jgi:N-methylhydantoinase A
VKVVFPGGAIDAGIIGRAAEAFHIAHEREYSFRLDSPVELVNFHIAGLVGVAKPDPVRITEDGRDLAQAARGRRRVDFAEDGVHDTSIYLRERLPVGLAIAGPVIIEEAATTVVVPPGQRAEMDAYGNIHIAINGQGSRS